MKHFKNTFKSDCHMISFLKVLDLLPLNTGDMTYTEIFEETSHVIDYDSYCIGFAFFGAWAYGYPSIFVRAS